MGEAERESLRILRENGEAFQSDIVRATGLSKAAVSEALMGLEERKIVRRSKVGRSSKVELVGAWADPRPRGTLRLGFTRAAEYPFLVPLRRALREDGVNLEFHIHENGVAVVRDLSLLRIDLAIAPMLTLFMAHSLDSPFKIIGPAGSGGSSLLCAPKAVGSLRTPVRTVSTRLSTMELLVRSAANQHIIPEVSEIQYATTPGEISKLLIGGSVDVCSIWEPYATMLEAQGAKRLVRYSDITEHYCCGLAAGDHLGRATVSKLSKRYADAIREFRNDRESYAASYSALVGLDSSVVRRVSSEYSYPSELSLEAATRQLEAAGLSVPAPSSFRDGIFRE